MRRQVSAAEKLIGAINAACSSLGSVGYGRLSIHATLEVVKDVAAIRGIEPTTWDYSDDPATQYIIVGAQFSIGDIHVSVVTDQIAKAVLP